MNRFFAAIQSFFRNLFGRKAPALLENRVFFHYPEGHDQDGEESVYYGDAYFFQDSRIDNPSLATCSLGLAMASFSSNQLKADLENQAGNAVDFLKKCGFCNIATPSYFSGETRKEGLAFAMGMKRLKQGKKTFTLIAIGVRGGNYGKEWSSNMKIGLGDRHEGFSLAAKSLRLSFEDYVRRNKVKKDLRVWVAGFSRAAAVTNLFAQDLPARMGKANVVDIYAYCFASPNVTRFNAMAPSHAHNYVNPNDAVALLPLAQWGYARYGQDIVLSCESEDDFASIHFALLHILDKQKRFRREPGADKAAFLQKVGELFGQRISVNDYVQRFQETLEEFMSLVDPRLENPYQALGDVVGGAVSFVLQERGAWSLLRSLRSPKTDWEALLLPALEASLSSNPYPIDAKKTAQALSDFLFLVREDVLNQRDFFLTLFDKQNLASILKEHRASLYLAALKRLDPKFTTQE